MKKRKKRHTPRPPPGSADQRTGELSVPPPAADAPDLASGAEPIDEDLLDQLDNLARSPSEIRSTDLMAIGLLALLCAILVAGVVAIAAIRHRHAEPRPPVHLRQVGWIESDHLCG